MTQDSLGIAVIDVGSVGRAHAAGCRKCGSLFDIGGRPARRLVAVADVYEPFTVYAAKRFGYERSETSWQAVVMHRQVVEALAADRAGLA